MDLWDGPHSRLILYYEGIYFNCTVSGPRTQRTLSPSVLPRYLNAGQLFRTWIGGSGIGLARNSNLCARLALTRALRSCKSSCVRVGGGSKLSVEVRGAAGRETQRSLHMQRCALA